MPAIEDSFMLDLTNKGSRKTIDLRGVDKLSISTPMPNLMGSAVIELKRSVGGVLESFSPIRILTATVDGTLSAIVNDIDEAVLEVTTPDSTAQDIVVNSFGETTRDDPRAAEVGETGLFVLVESKDDFPGARDGVITLVDEATYYIVGDIDLEGDRLVCGVDTCIIGSTSESSVLRSTGLTGTALITSEYSLPMRHVTITADVALALAGDGTSTALDWTGVNFLDCPTIGTVEDYSNFIMTVCAFLNSSGMTLDGTIGTVGFSNTLFDTASSGTAITIPSSATISRRFRITYSAFVTLSGETSLNISTSATIPVEGYILDTVNFAGGGTYTTGVQFDDNKALFSSCRGITNSAEIGSYTMINNATVTVISVSGTAVKILGTTTANPINQKFSHTNNRLTYTGALDRSFIVTVCASANSVGSAKQVGFYVAKNGTVIAESEIYVTTNTSSRAEGVALQTILDLSTNDYIEVFVENSTDTGNITVTELNTIVRSV